MAQSVKRLVTAWTVRGSNPGAGEFFAPVQTGPGVHSASYTTSTGSFPGVKRPGRGVDHKPTSSAEVKEKVNYISTSLTGIRGLFYGKLYSTLLYPYVTQNHVIGVAPLGRK